MRSWRKQNACSSTEVSRKERGRKGGKEGGGKGRKEGVELERRDKARVR